MALIFTHNPLEKMRLIQGFAQNLVGGDFYSKIGLKEGHNGWDLSTDAVSGKPCFAVADGEVVSEPEGDITKGYGLNARLFVDLGSDDKGNRWRLNIVYGHLQKVVKTGFVKAGEQIGECDNTGYSTGPHLHFGIRKEYFSPGGAGPYIDNYNNGFFGYIDPAKYFPKGVFDLPVDRRYGHDYWTSGVPSDLKFYTTNWWFWLTFKRLMTSRERNAFQFGFWDLRTVLDPAMFIIWSNYSKPEAIKRGLVK